MGSSLIAVALGAALGAIVRWRLGVWLDDPTSPLPPATLIVNVVGGYAVGVAVVAFGHFTAIAPEWRLFVITGLLGGLTTFSTFSAEIVHQLQSGRFAWAVAGIAAHLAGSLLATVAGIASARWWWLR